MSHTDETPPPNALTPPSEIGEMPETPSSWPTALGIVGIILASLGFVGGCCSIASPAIWPRYVEVMSGLNVPEQQLQMIKASQPPPLWAIFAGVVGLAMSTLLLTGSIKLIRRRAAGVSLSKIWAWISIPWAIISFLVAVAVQLKMAGEVQGAGANMAFGLGLTGCFVLVFGIGYPVFMLFWFMREKIKAEVDGWEAESRTMV